MIDQEKYDALMAPIVAKFKTRLRRDLASYQAFQKHLGKDVLPRDICETIKMETHKIAGSAKTLGFKELSDAAFEFEKCIEDILELYGLRLEDRKLISIFERFLTNLMEASAPSPGGESTEAPPLKSPMQGNTKYHVLVIDDDVFSRNLVKLALRNDSCKISEAATGLSGITFLKSETPDLIVLDVHLPDMEGFDVLKEIREQVGENVTPVAMLTRDEDADSLVLGIAGGALEYIRKPVSVDILGKRLMAALKYGKKPEPPDSPYHPKGSVTYAMKRFGFDK